jgi:hypothetical protein
MALTVRPDDEVYQFDTVWLGPDEYTLPIQARYVAWGTWLACFLVATVILIPLGGNGPAGVLGSLVWSLGLSVVLSRAVMLVVDHERPLRSLPALFSAEARAAMHSRRRGERSLLIKPGRITVRETPPKVLAMRERQRSRAAAKLDRARQADRTTDHERAVEPATDVAAVGEPPAGLRAPARTADSVVEELAAGPGAPAWKADSAVEEPAAGPRAPAWTADSAVDGWHARRTPAWSIRSDEHDVYEPAPVPVPVDDDEVHEFVRAPDPETVAPVPALDVAAAVVRRPEPAPAVESPTPVPTAVEARPATPTAVEPQPATRTAEAPPVLRRRGDKGGRTDPHRAESNGDGRAHPAGDEVDPHAALERRILLPARKDR